MKRPLSVLLVLVSLLSGCGGRTFDSIKKMVPIGVLVSMVAIASCRHDHRLKEQTARFMS